MIPLLAAALPSLFKIGKGIAQSKQGKSIAENNIRPTYTRPIEADRAEAIAEQGYYNSALPGQDRLEKQINSGTASAVRTLQDSATSSGDLIDGINRITAGNNQRLGDLRLDAAKFKLDREGNYTNILSDNARYSDQEFDYNQNMPYQDRAALASSLMGAGNQNTFSGVSELAGLGVSALDGATSKPSQPYAKPLMPSFKEYNPSQVLGTRMRYNPFTKTLTSE